MSMDNTIAASFPLARLIFPVGKPRHYLGAGISFFVHAVIVSGIYYLGPSLADFKPPLVIDFSIEQVSRPAKAKKVIAQPEPKPVPPPPVREEVVLPETTIPEKIETVEVPKIVPKKKKEIVEQIIPQPVVPEKIEPEVIEPEAVVKEQVAVVEEVAEEDQEESPSAQVTTRAKPQSVESLLSQRRQKYVKEHFDYIKDRVQSKITYPPIARRMGWQGKVLVSFVICRDGSVKDLRIRESSGHKALDKNALDIIRKQAPFPRPPVSAELIIPVLYKLS